MKKIGWGLVVGLTACSGPMVSTHHDGVTRFGPLKTVGWHTPAGHLGGGLPDDPSLDSRIKAAVEEVLAAKGFRVVSAPNPDLILEYAASAEEKADSDLEHSTTARWMGLTYFLGKLNLRMTRPSLSTAVWEGTVHTRIELSTPPEERNRKLRDAVLALLKKFPPA